MKPNIELMKRLRRRFLRMQHPGHFQMDVIASKTDCGTAMCIAGHVLDLAGYKMRLRPDYERSHVLDFDFFAPSGQKVRNPLATAAREMGLYYRSVGSNKANKLFHDWTLETPEDAAKRIGQLIEEYQR